MKSWSRAFALALLLLALPAGESMAQETGHRVQLPAPSLKGRASVEEALQQRRSVRDLARSPLALADVAQLLWSAQGVTHPEGLRTAPSAGALYPLEVYLAAGNVTGLAPGVYRYQPGKHELALVKPGDARRELASAALGQDWVRSAPAVIAIAAVYQRTARKYGARAERYVHIEVGHAAQNVYLQATARGLGTVIVGAFDDAKVQQALNLPADHAPLALLPVGPLR